MKINDDFFEESQCAFIGTKLSTCIEKKKILEVEYSNLMLRERYIPKRKKIAYGKIRSNFIFSLVLGIIIGGSIWIGFGLVFFLFMFIFQIPGILKIFCKTENGLKNKYDVEKQNLSKLISATSSKINKLEAEINELKALKEQYEQKEQVLPEEQANQTHLDDNTSHIATKSGNMGKSQFSLKETETINKTEIKRELRTDIAKAGMKIEEQYNNINRFRHNIVEIDEKYMKMKKEILVFLACIAILEVISNFLSDGIDNVIGLCSLCITVFLIILIITKYKETMFDYLFEHNEGLFKDYAFCNELTSNERKINDAYEIINELKQQIEEDKIKIDWLRN